MSIFEKCLTFLSSNFLQPFFLGFKRILNIVLRLATMSFRQEHQFRWRADRLRTDILEEVSRVSGFFALWSHLERFWYPNTSSALTLAYTKHELSISIPYNTKTLTNSAWRNNFSICIRRLCSRGDIISWASTCYRSSSTISTSRCRNSAVMEPWSSRWRASDAIQRGIA